MVSFQATPTDEPSSGQDEVSASNAVLHVPRRLEIAGKIEGNPIQKLAFVEHERGVSLSTFTRGRTNALIATDASGRTTFLTGKRTKAEVECDEVLCTAGADGTDALPILAKNPGARWLKPASIAPSDENIVATEAKCAEIVRTWKDKFEFREEQKAEDGTATAGLRRPQIGAVHAALAHWSVDHKAATIVMPTGTGKTETMLALLVCAQIQRLLVIVPTSALRDQLTEKFLTLGVLERSGCLLPGAALPVVASLHHAPKSLEEVDAIFRRANVIVSTMQVAARCSEAVQVHMADLCSHLFIDEAHHIAARTWYEFKQKFAMRSVVQFTATPFRTDGKRIDGKFIYNYPLSKAQAEGYFRPIRFIAVNEFDPDDAHKAIARKARECLEKDLAAGYDHVLMARVDTIARAATVHAIYMRELPTFAPVLIHSDMPALERRESLARLHSRDSRVVVCVDMFGEGFDFPELKIAALHDRHKSLAITLQFVGRFTRTKSSIGEASVVANTNDEAIADALRNLYAEDADWNFLLRMLSEGATDKARKRTETIEGFTGALPDIPLQTLFPRMSAVVYRTSCEKWEPLRVEDVIHGARLHAGPVINPEKNLAIFVTRDEEAVRWGSVKQIQNVEWNLYVLHWNEELKLLFINSSKPKEFHEDLATAVTGSKDRILGESVFRALSHINRLTLTNLGLSHALGKNIRYTMFMGADIADGLSEAATFNKRKSNVFGLGYEDDEKTTVGCSFKGRFWSHKIAFDLSEWTDWCAHVGRKLLDETLSTDAVFANIVKARRLSGRPDLVPVMVSWPEGFQEEPEDVVLLEVGTLTAPLFECDIEIEEYTASGPLAFSVVVGEARATFEIRLSDQGAEYVQRDGLASHATIRGKKRPLGEWFSEDPPIVHFANGDFLVFNELFELPRGIGLTFPKEKIAVWDWSGIDIRKESQGEAKHPDSIQRRVIETVLAGHYGDFDIVFDDDGSGEAADVVAVKRIEKKIVVDLFHCKFSSDATPGARVEDLFFVCGQAQKSVRWREDPRKLLRHLLHREALRTESNRASRFEKGDRRSVQQLINAAREATFEYHVHIVQPGLSQAAISPAQCALLGATENFLKETYSMSLDLISSG